MKLTRIAAAAALVVVLAACGYGSGVRIVKAPTGVEATR